MIPDERPERTLNDLVNDAILRWMDLIGIDFEGNIKGSSPWSSYHLRDLTEDLSASRELDPTGLTTFMMLRGILEHFLKDITFTAFDLILEPRAISAKLAPMKALRTVLEDPQVVDLIANFQDKVRTAALQYGVRPGEATDKLEELLADKYQLAMVRRDAMLSMANLEPHQFTQGPKEPNPLKYNPTIFEFWNVNSILASMRSQRVAGISLCLIRDPVDAMFSYFVFAIRNGSTLTILTDRDKEPHPAFSRMTRRPDRSLSRRAARNWFPYQLLDLKEQKDELGNVKGLYANARTQLVPINVEAVPLKSINELEPEQFVWTSLVFELILDKYWKQDEKLPELSYTGQMVVEPAALVGAAGALVKDGLYKPLELPKLVKADVTAETTAPQWVSEPVHFNAWMVERYGARVPDEVLSPVGEEAQLLLVERTHDPSFLPVLEKSKRIEKFETLNPTTFGTKDQIQKDRLWVARVNQMKAIQVLADEEYEREKDGVLAWYRAAVTKNRGLLIDAACRGEWMLPYMKFRRMHEQGGDKPSEQQAIKQGVGEKWSKAFDSYFFNRPRIYFGEEDKESYRTKCCVRTDTWASIFTVIKPTCPDAIAILCGVTFEELPWPLQHWFTDTPYTGNHILNRLDPEDWHLHNPWMDITHRRGGLNLDVGVALSKLAYHARRKTMGLPRKTWETEEDDE